MFSSYKIRLSSVDSTNNYAAKLLKETNVQEFTAILADEQWGGKGQRSSTWESESGKNLTLSYVLKPQVTLDRQFEFSMLTALACVDMLTQFGFEPEIKWPNDIYMQGYKLGGILIENVIRGNVMQGVILGVGLNVNQTKFEHPKAGSMKMFTGKDFDLTLVEDALLEKILAYYLQWRGGKDFTSAYYKVMLGYQKEVLFEDLNEGTQFKAWVMGVNKNGQLHLKHSGTDHEVFYDIKALKWLI